jgi:putative FmdB family regulatory protein
MPFYEYQCKNCGHALEAMQKITASPLKKCPHCGKAQLVRLMSAPVFRLKGGGWYETDFKGDKDNQRNLADKPEAADAAKDAKPADGKSEKTKDEAKGSDVKGSESPSAKESAPVKEKSADAAPKAPEKSAASGAASKPASGKSARGSRSRPVHAAPKRAAKRPVAKAKGRR